MVPPTPVPLCENPCLREGAPEGMRGSVNCLEPWSEQSRIHTLDQEGADDPFPTTVFQKQDPNFPDLRLYLIPNRFLFSNILQQVRELINHS